MKHSTSLEDDYVMVEKYIEKGFNDKKIKTPDYIYGSIIYSLLDNNSTLDAYRVINRAFFEEVVLDIGIYESVIKKMIEDKFNTSYIAVLYKVLSHDFKPNQSIISILLNSDLKDADKIAELIVKDAIKTGNEDPKADKKDPRKYEEEFSLEKEISEINVDTMFNQFLKDGNYMILGGVNEDEPFTIEIKDKEGNTIYSIESEDILEHVVAQSLTSDSDDDSSDSSDTDQ